MYDRSVFVPKEVKEAEVTAVGRDVTSSNTERAVPEYQISDHHTFGGEGVSWKTATISSNEYNLVSRQGVMVTSIVWILISIIMLKSCVYICL